MNKSRYINFECKFMSDKDTELGRLTGYGSKFNNIDNIGDIVLPGAFKKSLNDKAAKGQKFPFLWQHDATQPIGVIDNIFEDDKGLVIEVQLNLDSPLANEARSLVKMGAISGLSIGYTVMKDDWEGNIRKIKEAKLYEVSLVTFPCNEMATVNSIKSDYEEETKVTLEEVFRMLTDVELPENLNKEEWEFYMKALDSLLQEYQALEKEDAILEELLAEESFGDDLSWLEAESDTDVSNSDEPLDKFWHSLEDEK